MPLFTVYDTNANAVAVETKTVPNPGTIGQPPTYSEVPVRTLDRISSDTKGEGKWTRVVLLDTLAKRLAPLVNGASNFKPGWVLLEVVDIKPTPGTGEVLSPTHDGGVADIVNGTMTYTWTTEFAPIADRKQAMKDRATARSREVIAAGKSINGIVIDLSAEGFERLNQAKAAIAGGYGQIIAVTKSKEPIDLPNEAAVDAVITAARAHYLDAVKIERQLYDAIDAAADQSALSAIDVEAGTGGDAAGWPAA